MSGYEPSLASNDRDRVELTRETLGEPLLLIPLPKDQQPGIARKILLNRFDTNRFLPQKTEVQLPNIV